jgi:hypothetical protein
MVYEIIGNFKVAEPISHTVNNIFTLQIELRTLGYSMLLDKLHHLPQFNPYCLRISKHCHKALNLEYFSNSLCFKSLYKSLYQ